MISTENFYESKNPWTWLLWGDKGIFTIAWTLVGIVATWVSCEYEWQVILATIAFFSIVLAVLIAYRIKDYRKRVFLMDILSFRRYKELKDGGHI